MDQQDFCNIRYKHSNKKRKDNACLVTFSNGRLKAGEDTDNMQFNVYAKSFNSTPVGSTVKKRRILVANTERMSYVGESYDEDNNARNCNYFLCVVNKRKNKMKIYDTNLYLCKPVLEVNDDLGDKSEKSFREKVDDLTNQFGSKAKKRSLKSRKKYQVNEEDMAQSMTDAVETSVTSTGANEEGEETPIDENNILPPINREAVDVSEVYNILDIITSNEYQELELRAEELINATDDDIQKWKTEAKRSKLLLNYIRNHRGNVTLEKAKLLVYYDYLMQFFRLGYRDFMKKDPCPDIPEPFKSGFFDRFVVKSYTQSGRQSKTIPPRMKDKIISYVLVISLFVHDFVVDLTLILTDFKYGQAKLIKIVHAMGCHVVYNKKGNSLQSQRLAQLKFPLFTVREDRIKGRGRK